MSKKRNDQIGEDGSATLARREFLATGLAVTGSMVTLTASARAQGLGSKSPVQGATGARARLGSAQDGRRMLGTLEVSSIGLECMSMTSGSHVLP